MEIYEKMFEVRDDNYAVSMKSYMRNKFEFLGVNSKKRKEICKFIFKNLKNSKEIDRNFVVKFFNEDYREFQYITIDYLIKMKKYLKIEDVFLIKQLITEKSWWDTVDILSGNLVGEICRKYPSLINNEIIFWINHENMWLRRSSIIFQLRYKMDTNLEVLKDAIKSNIYDNDFFIKKAIGWALREYSKVNPEWVKDFINNYQLSRLSKREAEKYIKKR